MKVPYRLIAAASLAIMSVSSLALNAQTRTPAFPQNNGVIQKYRHYDSEGRHDADFVSILNNFKGDMTNGSLDLVYHFTHSDGKPFFDGNNEFTMNISRVDGQTYINMDKMSKSMKILDLISSGDVSSISVPMTVGETLPDSMILTTISPFKVTLTISDKKVLDHKYITVGGKSYECWLVHEKISTKTPFSTDTATADTWYAKDAGCVKQTVYDANGQVKGKFELLSISL